MFIRDLYFGSGHLKSADVFNAKQVKRFHADALH